MKVTFKNMVGGYSGKADELIYYYVRRLNRTYARRRPVNTGSQPQRNLAAAMANLKQIQPSEGFKQDSKAYLELYNQLSANKWRPAYAWNNLYIKMLYALASAYPAVDLQTLTREQIYDQALPCSSVKTAVEAGLLPWVKGYEKFSNQL